MDELSLYEKILTISRPWVVESVDLDEPENTVHIHVEFDRDTPLECPLCSERCSRYDTRKRTWRHLDSCQFKTLVHAEIPRSQCKQHGILQADIPWAEDHSRFTALFESLVISWLQDASINAVRKKFGLSWNAVDGIMQRSVNRGLDRKPKRCYAHLAVDEVNCKKGREYVTIVSNESGHVLEVNDNRSKESLSQFFRRLSARQRETISTISMDMSPSYIYSTKEHISQWETAICFDKFHVAMDLNKAVNSVRQMELKEMPKEYRSELHRSRFTWLRSEKSLKDRHIKQMEALSAVAKKTARASAIREYAMGLWDFGDRLLAEAHWEYWYGWAARSKLNPIKAAAKSVKKNLWGIINAIINKKSNARAESINSRIKIIKTKANGFRNKERFKRAILFHLGGLDLFPYPKPT